VALMPCPSNEDLRTCEKDFKIVCCVGTGPGGQHRNKTCSAVRVTHLKTGVTAYADTRSQHQSKRLAMAVVLDRLKEQQNGQQRAQHNDMRRVQIGSMGRGSRVRTYNFIDNRVTDERCDKSFRPEDIMKGGLERIYREVRK
jgi:peptide chain release factor 1